MAICCRPMLYDWMCLFKIFVITARLRRWYGCGNTLNRYFSKDFCVNQLEKKGIHNLHSFIYHAWLFSDFPIILLIPNACGNIHSEARMTTTGVLWSEIGASTGVIGGHTRNLYGSYRIFFLHWIEIDMAFEIAFTDPKKLVFVACADSP